MGNLKEVRIRIGSVKNTQQITRAMKVVSAAKLRRATQRIQQIRPYAEKLQYMLGQLADSLEGSDATKWYEQRPVKKVLMVIITSDRGLAGGFNSSILKESLRRAELDYKSKGVKVEFITVGKKAKDGLKKSGNVSIQDNDTLFSNLTFEASESIISLIMDKFLNGDYDAIDVCYNKFKNAAIYFTTVERFLPIPVENKVEASGPKKIGNFVVNYIFEPSKEEILARLIGMSLKISFYRFLLDSNAAEHGARMTAMDKATDNAEEMLKALKLQYNKERQAMITKEILEIVGGAAALGN